MNKIIINAHCYRSGYASILPARAAFRPTVVSSRLFSSTRSLIPPFDRYRLQSRPLSYLNMGLDDKKGATTNKAAMPKKPVMPKGAKADSKSAQKNVTITFEGRALEYLRMGKSQREQFAAMLEAEQEYHHQMNKTALEEADAKAKAEAKANKPMDLTKVWFGEHPPAGLPYHYTYTGCLTLMDDYGRTWRTPEHLRVKKPVKGEEEGDEKKK